MKDEDCEIIELNYLMLMTCIKIAFIDDDALVSVDDTPPICAGVLILSAVILP